jgi:DNA mismatch endonuclease (patch repair protein)
MGREPMTRSEMMARVRTRNTSPELAVRSELHRRGYRFRLHRRDLPGTPDIVLPRYRTAVFVHGCFWHGHNCPKGKRPKSNAEFWNKKLDENLRRAERQEAELTSLGWRTHTVWECQQAEDIESLFGKLGTPARRKDA